VSQRLWGWGLPPEEASADKRAGLSDKAYEAYLRAYELAPGDSDVQYGFAVGNFDRCDADRPRVESAKTIALNPYDASHLGFLSNQVAFVGDWDDVLAMAEKAIKLAGPATNPTCRWTPAKRHFFRGEYQAAYDDFQRAYSETYWLSHLDLAYTLPYLGRLDEAKAHVAKLLQLFPTMTIREADGLYKLTCFPQAYRERMVDALRKAGLPE